MLLLALAANLWLAGWWVVALAGLAAAVLPLGLACAAILTTYLLALGLDPEAVALSPFGPTQAGRFYGITNLLATMLLVPALLGAALLGRLGAAVAAIAVVAVAGSRFGADGGGLLVLLAAYATYVVRRHGLRVDARRGALLAVVAVAAGVALVALDAASGGSSHVTDAIGDGPEPSSVTSPIGSSSRRAARSQDSARRSPRWRRWLCCSSWRHGARGVL